MAEFHEWYAPMLEEEALFGKRGNTIGETGTEDDNRHNAITVRMQTLASAIENHSVTSPVQSVRIHSVRIHYVCSPQPCVAETPASAHPER